MRLVAATGFVVCFLAASLRAAGDDATRFRDTAKALIQAINANDQDAIQASFTAQMQQALPPDKSAPFFRQLLAANGKLKSAAAPQVAGDSAVVRVTAERGTWDFKITLDSSGKIAGLLVTPSASKETASTSTQRFTKVVNKLARAINGGDEAAIQGLFDSQMQQALPPDKATPFFSELLSSVGKLKKAGVPQITGDSALVRITTERGSLDFRITLDAADKISGLTVVPSDSAAATESSDVPRSRTPMQLPFRGEWYVFWGGDSERVNYHVRVPGQRRAADLVIRGSDNLSHKDGGRRNEDYFAYGEQILAAAPGTVVTAIDGVPDNAPGSMNPLCAVGNCLIVDHGVNEYAVYAHLQPGSLKVHKGEKVRQGQVLGLCGNSGNSSEPHLHFHLQDKAALQDGAGITPFFANVKCRRGDATLTESEYTFLQGDRIQPKRTP